MQNDIQNYLHIIVKYKFLWKTCGINDCRK